MSFSADATNRVSVSPLWILLSLYITSIPLFGGEAKSGFLAISSNAPIRLKSRNSSALVNHFPE